MMSAEHQRVPSEREVVEEGDSVLAGPGVVATKSQTRGGIAGISLGGGAGALVGALLGALIFGGIPGIVITAVCFAFAGGTIGVLVGGFTNTKGNVSPTSPADN